VLGGSGPTADCPVQDALQFWDTPIADTAPTLIDTSSACKAALQLIRQADINTDSLQVVDPSTAECAARILNPVNGLNSSQGSTDVYSLVAYSQDRTDENIYWYVTANTGRFSDVVNNANISKNPEYTSGYVLRIVMFTVQVDADKSSQEQYMHIKGWLPPKEGQFSGLDGYQTQLKP
jgi:hypothetical protein